MSARNESARMAGEAYALMVAGRLPLALRLLQGASQSDDRGARPAALEVTQGIAIALGLSGFPDEASQTLARILPKRIGQERSAQLEIIRGCIAFLDNDALVAVKAATNVLAMPSKTLAERNQSLALLAATHLRIGYWNRARRLVDAMEPAVDMKPDMGWCIGQLLRGKIYLQEALVRSVTAPWLPDGRKPGGEMSTLDTSELSSRALHAFAFAQRSCQSCDLIARLATAHSLVARALVARSDGPLLAFESHLEWLRRAGLIEAQRDWRWTVGLLHLSRGQDPLARTWLVPLMNDALGKGIALHEIELIDLVSRRLQKTEPGEVPLGRGFVPESSRKRLALMIDRLDLLDLDALLQGRKARRSRSDDELIGQIKDQIRQNLHQRQNISEMAFAQGVSRRKLELSFRNVTGSSPQQYVTELRVQEARRKMSQHRTLSPATLRHIAIESGFVSYQRFIQAYAATFGVSPVALTETRRGKPLALAMGFERRP